MKRLLFFCLPIVFFIEGCSIEKISSKRHDFGLPLYVANGQTTFNPVIKVSAPTWFSDASIHYRLLYNSPTTLRAYQLDSWIASPPELFQHYLLAVGLKLSAPLEIRLLDFEQQFTNPKTAYVVLRFVAEYAGNEGEAILSREFMLKQYCKTADSAGATSAFSDLVQIAVNRLRLWLSSVEQGSAVNLH